MRRTRRRRSGGTWFPALGSDSGGVEGYNFAGRELFTTMGSTTAASSVLIVPLTFDRPQDPESAGAGDPLVGLIGSEYLLKRIVGKIHISRTPHEQIVGSAPTSQRFDLSPATQVGCGFFVARAQDDVSGDPDQPIGANTATERNDNYNPLDVDNIRLPWIWRRTWVLGSYGLNFQAFTDTSTFARKQNYNVLFPPTNVQYGSVLDGPHFDAKSRRRIRQEERLWFVMAQAPYLSVVDDDPDPANQALIVASLDYRIFGSLRKAKNRSAF